MTDEGDRFFYAEQDRRREKRQRMERARRRIERRQALAEQKSAGVKPSISKWTIDEHGNMSRVLEAEQ